MMAMNIAGLGGYSRRARGAHGSFLLCAPLPRDPAGRPRQRVAAAAALRTLRQICGTFTISSGRRRSRGNGCKVGSVVRIDALQHGERFLLGGVGQ